MEWAGVFEEVAGHPMVLARTGDVLECLAQVTAIELSSAGSGRTDVGDGEAGVVGHGDEGGLAEAGVAEDSNLFCVDGLVGLKVVEGATSSPGSGTDASPNRRVA